MKIYFEHYKSPRITWSIILIGIEYTKLTQQMISVYTTWGRHRFEINFIY